MLAVCENIWLLTANVPYLLAHQMPVQTGNQNVPAPAPPPAPTHHPANDAYSSPSAAAAAAHPRLDVHLSIT